MEYIVKIRVVGSEIGQEPTLIVKDDKAYWNVFGNHIYFTTTTGVEVYCSGAVQGWTIDPK